MRLVVVLYALSLVAYPVWGLVSPEAYREALSALPQAAGAGLEKLQMAAALHFMKNAYLAFLMLLLARFLGSPDRPRDVRTAGILLVAFPVVTLVYVVLA